MTTMTARQMDGAGNVFAFFDGGNAGTEDDMIKTAKEICASEGLDGAVFLFKDGLGYRWEFFNSDGSKAEMCGNAARCVGAYLRGVEPNVRFPTALSTGAGTVVVHELGHENYQVEMSPACDEREITLRTSSGSRDLFFVNTGVPHLVRVLKDNETPEGLLLECRELRLHPDLGSGGANITLIQKRHGSLHAVTFERGVENFTAACGTGAVAAAVWNRRRTGELSCRLRMPGGELGVDISGPKPLLSGPARIVRTFAWEKK